MSNYNTLLSVDVVISYSKRHFWWTASITRKQIYEMYLLIISVIPCCLSCFEGCSSSLKSSWQINSLNPPSWPEISFLAILMNSLRSVSREGIQPGHRSVPILQASIAELINKTSAVKTFQWRGPSVRKEKWKSFFTAFAFCNFREDDASHCETIRRKQKFISRLNEINVYPNR